MGGDDSGVDPDAVGGVTDTEDEDETPSGEASADNRERLARMADLAGSDEEVDITKLDARPSGFGTEGARWRANLGGI